MNEKLWPQVEITEKNKHWFTDSGLPKDLSLFYAIHPEDFREKTFRFVHAIYLILILALWLLIYNPSHLQLLADLTKFEIPQISDLVVRVGSGVAILILAVMRFVANTSVWINIKTGGKIKRMLTFHHITQWRFNADEIVELFENREFGKIFKLEADESSNIFLHADQDKKGKTIYLMLGEFDNYAPVPMTQIAVISGKEYDALINQIPRE